MKELRFGGGRGWPVKLGVVEVPPGNGISRKEEYGPVVSERVPR